MTIALSLLLGRHSSAGRCRREAGFPDGIAELIVTISTLRFFCVGGWCSESERNLKNGCETYVLHVLCPHNSRILNPIMTSELSVTNVYSIA